MKKTLTEAMIENLDLRTKDEEMNKKNIPKTGDKHSPYYLIIHTNSYTGNFERELIGFSIGRLIGANNKSFKKYITAFWNCECASDIDSLEEFKNAKETIGKIREETDKKLLNDLIEKRHLSIEEAKDRITKFRDKMDKKNYLESLERIYDTYLDYSNQWVDDLEEDTFYNIFSYSKEENSLYDSIYIQLKDILPEKFEEIIVRRIIKFFELDIYNTFKNYEYLCQFCDSFKADSKPELLDLELIDFNGILIKKYV